MKIVEWTLEGSESIVEYATKDPFNPYRQYPLAKLRGKGPLYAREILEALGRRGSRLWAAIRGGDTLGLVGLEALEWDSAHFGLSMGRLWPISVSMAEGEAAREAAEQLLAAAEAGAQEAKISHLAARVDGEAFPLVHALERRGFLLMDTLVTFLVRRGKDPVPEDQGLYLPRLFRDRDLEAVLEIARQGEYKGRLSRDPWVDQDRVSRMVEAWARRCCDLTLADEVLVAEACGAVKGFLGYRKNRFFTDQTGLELWGGGLGIAARGDAEAYDTLLRAALTREFDGRDRSVQPHVPDLIEIETQLANVTGMRVWQESGYRMVRFSHALHRGKP